MTNTKQNQKSAAQATILTGALTFIIGGVFGCVEEAQSEDISPTDAAKALTVDTTEASNPRYWERGERRGNRDGRHVGHDKRDGRRHGKRHSAADGLFKAALDDATLTTAQRTTIESILESQRTPRSKPRFKQNSEHRDRFAEAVRNGKWDRAEHAARAEERAKKRAERSATREEALKSLHNVLDENQRQAVVAAVQAHASRGSFEKGDRNGRRGGSHPQKGKHDRGDKLFNMVNTLALSTEQRQALEAVHRQVESNRPSPEERVAKRKERKSCHTAFIASFATENFDPADHQCREIGGDEKSERMSRRAKTFESVMAILTVDQRNQLADNVSSSSSREPRNPREHRKHPQRPAI